MLVILWSLATPAEQSLLLLIQEPSFASLGLWNRKETVVGLKYRALLIQGPLLRVSRPTGAPRLISRNCGQIHFVSGCALSAFVAELSGKYRGTPATFICNRRVESLMDDIQSVSQSIKAFDTILTLLASQVTGIVFNIT